MQTAKNPIVHAVRYDRYFLLLLLEIGVSSLLSDLSVSSNKPFDSDGGMVEWRQVANEVRRNCCPGDGGRWVGDVLGVLGECSRRACVLAGDVDEETVHVRTYRAGEGAD